MTEKIDKFGGTIRFKELMKILLRNLTLLTNLVKQMIENSIESLLLDDEKLFSLLQKRMDDVHLFKERLEKNVIDSIALHQPFASDLRFLVSSLKISNEIHRSAHDAVHIANSTKYLSRDMNRYSNIVEDIVELAEKSLFMYRTSVEAFLDRRALDLKYWVQLDNEVDHLHEKIINSIKKVMISDCTNIDAGVSLILATRYIERIADHACNIVEESTFVVTSKREKII